jgi:murein L,D-transpeptidase YafK
MILLLAVFSSPLQAEELQGVEPRLIKAIDNINQQRIDAALVDVQDLIEKAPQFHLAQLVYADLLMAKAGMPRQLGLSATLADNNRVANLRDEARVRWQRYQEKLDDAKLPDVLLQLSPKQKTVIVTDLSRSRLYLYENSDKGPRLLSDFYVTQGKNGKGKHIEGDSKTPLGTYFVTSSLDTEKLPDLYGTGAFPIDYPNAWDRRQGKTGHGIWLHGVPSNTYSRVPLDTRGCLAMSNPELDAIKPFLHSGITPVIISSKLNWITPEELSKESTAINKQLEHWLTDWKKRDVEAYLEHYSSDFRSDGKNYQQWAEHKRRVNESKEFIEVQLNNVSILRYPDQQDMVVVSYEQDYRSNNFNGIAHKRQYWKKEKDGQWRIVYEGRG